MRPLVLWISKRAALRELCSDFFHWSWASALSESWSPQPPKRTRHAAAKAEPSTLRKSRVVIKGLLADHTVTLAAEFAASRVEDKT